MTDDAAVKYVYRAPEFPHSKPSKSAFLAKIGSYFLVASVFLLLGFLIGQRIKIPIKPTAATAQSSVTFQTTAKGAVTKDDQLTISQDGQVTYLNRQIKKQFKTQIAADRVQTFTNQILSANFFQLENNYSVGCSSCLTYTITVNLGTTSKTVRTEWGAKREPVAMTALINSYERLVAEIKQTQGI